MLHAVIVGIDSYADAAIRPLRCAAADARALAELFQRRLAREEVDVRLHVDAEATRDRVRSAIVDDLPQRLEPDDVVLLYFACHGAAERPGPGDRRARYLIAHDTQFTRIHGTGFNMDRDVGDWFGQLSDARLVILILDACFSGAADGRSMIGPLLRERPVLTGFMDDPRPVSLKNLDLGRGRIILGAADEDQPAVEQPKLGHGIFTRHLLAALQKPRGGAQTVSLTTLYEEISEGVRRDTNRRQEPVVTMIHGKHAGLPNLAVEPGAGESS